MAHRFFSSPLVSKGILNLLHHPQVSQVSALVKGWLSGATETELDKPTAARQSLDPVSLILVRPTLC